MAEIALTEEDYSNIALRIKINNLSRIATLIPTQYSLIKVVSALGTIKRKPDVVEYERHNLSRYLRFDEEINDAIKKFIEKLEKYENLVNLNTLHKNLKSAKINGIEVGFIEKIKEKLGLSGTAGVYYPHGNKIKLIHRDFYDVFSSTLTHELLHLASSTKQGIMSYCGFKQFNSVTDVEKGRGINEGATEFINKTIFEYSYDEVSYTELVFLVKGIADLIGRDKIFQLYFDNDLKGLLYEISKYSDKKTASSIITAIDRLYELKYRRLTKTPSSIAKDLEENLISLIANLNLKKQQELLKKNEITKEEYDKNTRDIFMYSIGCIVEEKNIHSVNNKTYIITYKYNSIYVTEKEYKRFIEKCKNVLTDLTSQEDDYILYVMDSISMERHKTVRHSDSIYGSVQGFYDVQGNSLDNIEFNYKIFITGFNKAFVNGDETIEICDKNGVSHQIDFESANMMRNSLWDACMDYYFDNYDGEVGDSLIELEDMMDDYNNSEIEDLHSGDSKEI